jgi:hypothetical protein
MADSSKISRNKKDDKKPDKEDKKGTKKMQDDTKKGSLRIQTHKFIHIR